MLNEIIAEEFIKSLTQFENYTISILNYNGIVIFSTDRDKINDSLDISIVNKTSKGKSDEYQISCSVVIEDKTIGYIQVKGKDKELLPIARALVMALEIRIQYDKLSNKEKKIYSLNDEIIKYIVEYEPARKNELVNLFKKGNYRININRCILIIKTEDSNLENNVMNTNFYYDSNDDIIAVYDHCLIVLKECEHVLDDNLKLYIKEYLDFLMENTILYGVTIVSSAGSSFTELNINYAHTKWLYDNLNSIFMKNGKNIYYFEDNINYFLFSTLDMNLLNGVFNPLVKRMKNLDIEEYMKIVHALIECNFSITNASKALFIHKNTLTYKIEKYKRELKIDPLNVEHDREWFKNLYYYFLTRNKKEWDNEE